ncbi:MAG: DUF4911 domain-containing protein [Geobacteraceae bacterium]|nr:DUF4911 domain-containing protein [Geobacteraceae bacterium]
MLPSRGDETCTAFHEVVRYYKVQRSDVVFLKFILEAYEGMSTLSTVEPREAIVRLSVPVGFDADMQRILESLGDEISISETEFRPEHLQNA